MSVTGRKARGLQMEEIGCKYHVFYLSLKNPRDGGAWWAAVYGVAQSRTRLK